MLRGSSSLLLLRSFEPVALLFCAGGMVSLGN
jgi:hypothetical protein